MAKNITNGIRSTDGNIYTLIPPMATNTTLGGIVAKEKTTENSEVAIDSETGKAYVNEYNDAEIKQSIENNRTDICELKETLGNLAVFSERITSDIFRWGNLDNNTGEFVADTQTTLKNIFSDIININADGIIIKPLNNDTIFKVAYYNKDGSFISVSPWMGLNSFVIVNDYTINGGEYCRICIANSSTSVTTNTISDHLGRYNFTYVDFLDAEKLKGEIHGNDLKLPFDGFLCDVNIYKDLGNYYTDFTPQDKMVKVENGVVVYMSPSGNNANDGLTMLTPKKALTSALGVANVETIILLEGEYASGTNYSDAQQVTQPINLIGLGNVIFNNGTNNAINFYRSVYCENIHFKGGNDTVVSNLANYERMATFYKCEFSNSTTLNGLSILGGIAYVVDCIAFENAFDGFNYHEYNGVANHCIEIGCASYGNGTYHLAESDGQSSNATTSHDGSFIVRVNGDYKCCHGGVVADKETKSAIYGCKSGISTITNSGYPDRMSNYWSSGAEMYLFDCVSYGSKYDTAIVNGGTITSNIQYPSNYSN